MASRMQRTVTVIAPAAASAEKRERRAPSSRMAARGRSRGAFRLPLWFNIAATSAAAAAIAVGVLLQG